MRHRLTPLPRLSQGRLTSNRPRAPRAPRTPRAVVARARTRARPSPALVVAVLRRSKCRPVCSLTRSLSRWRVLPSHGTDAARPRLSPQETRLLSLAVCCEGRTAARASTLASPPPRAHARRRRSLAATDSPSIQETACETDTNCGLPPPRALGPGRTAPLTHSLVDLRSDETTR